MDRTIDEAEVAEKWNRNATVWTKEVRSGLDLYRELYTFPAFLDFAPDVRGKRVIDLGCGEGTNTRAFAKRGGLMTGVDLSEAMIEQARLQEEKEPLGIAYHVGSYGDLSSLPEEHFECAISTMALMDGPDLPAAFRASYRVLKHGGTLCFSVLHPCFVTPAIRWLRDEQGGYSGLRVGRYFDTQPFVDRWRFKRDQNAHAVEEPEQPFEVPRFPRTLSDYINALVAAGFRIARLEEPRPSGKLAREHEWLNRWHQHAPLVLFGLAVKEEAGNRPHM